MLFVSSSSRGISSRSQALVVHMAGLQQQSPHVSFHPWAHYSLGVRRDRSGNSTHIYRAHILFVEGGRKSSEMENPGFFLKDEEERMYTDSST